MGDTDNLGDWHGATPAPKGGERRPVIAQVLHRLDVAGAEVLAAGLARKLAATEASPYRFVFLCLDGVGVLGEQLAGEGFAVLDLQRRPGLDLGVALRLRKAVRDWNVDLVHAHQYTPFFYAAAARGGAARPAILFTEHGRHYPDLRRSRRVLANRVLLRRCDRVTAVGRFVREALVDKEGIAAQRIEVIHNGIDPSRFALDDVAGQRVRASLGLSAHCLVALQVARFHTVKDHVTSVRAFAQVAARVPHAVLLLAGDGPERAPIEALASEMGLRERVRFLGLRRDIPELMRAADVFVLSSLSEGISLTLLEAMASPLPIVATDVGGNREVVAHGGTGLLSPRQDPAAMAHHWVRVLQDAPLRRRLAAAGKQRLMTQFTESRMHAAYAGLYARMLAGPAYQAQAG